MRYLFLNGQESAGQNKQVVLLPVMLLAVVITLVLSFFMGPLLAPYQFPPWAVLSLQALVASYPLIWLLTWNKHRLCFVLASVILLTGDFAPAISSPVVALITAPNFLYLLYKHRNSRIKYFLLPFILLGGLYFFSAFLLNFVGQPVQISYGLMVDLGWLSSFGGGLIIYHMIYMPMIVYHLACSDSGYFKSYMFTLSLLINLIALTGLYQFFLNGLNLPEGSVYRAASIMRITTRLAPFIVVSLPLLITGLLKESGRNMRLYWWISIAMNVFLLMVTYTRGAIISAGVLWFFLLASLVASRSWKTLFQVVCLTLFLVTVVATMGHLLDLSFFTRFETERMESSMDKRFLLWDTYMNGIGVQHTSVYRSLANMLLGYGWFSERAFVSAINKDTHNTFFSTFATYGLVGMILYFWSYVWMLVLTFKHSLNASIAMRPRYAMACALLVIFLLSGLVHNKLYSPIESAYTWLLIGVLLWEDLPTIFPHDWGRAKPHQKPKKQGYLLCLKQ